MCNLFTETGNNDSYKYGRAEVRMELLEKLWNSAFDVKLVKTVCEHCCIVDKEIVWYGSVNLLSKEEEEDNIMRVCSRKMVAELLEMTVLGDTRNYILQNT